MPTTFLNSGDAVLLNPTATKTVSGTVPKEEQRDQQHGKQQRSRLYKDIDNGI